MSDQSKTVDRFISGYACSQAILAQFGSRFGLEAGKAMRIAAGFAGGMRMGETCGAVTGAFMVIGLAFSTDDCDKPDGRKAVYRKISEFVNSYREAHGTVSCRELLGCDISTAEGMKRAIDEKLFTTACPEFVRSAERILDAMIDG